MQTGCSAFADDSGADTRRLLPGGYYSDVAQWSKGEYSDASNREDDLAIIASNVPHVADDHSEPCTAATPLPNSTSKRAWGIIETTGDADTFAFQAPAGPIRVTVAVPPGSRNLDVQATLLDASCAPLAAFDTVDSLSVSPSIFGAAAAGAFYLRVTGVGSGDPLEDGYTAYASLGRYGLVVDVGDAAATPSTGSTTSAASFESSLTSSSTTLAETTAASTHSLSTEPAETSPTVSSVSSLASSSTTLAEITAAFKNSLSTEPAETSPTASFESIPAISPGPWSSATGTSENTAPEAPPPDTTEPVGRPSASYRVVMQVRWCGGGTGVCAARMVVEQSGGGGGGGKAAS